MKRSTTAQAAFCALFLLAAALPALASDTTTELIYQGEGAGAVSSDARHIAFCSTADDLVPGDGNGTTDVFVFDRATGTTELVSVSTAGVQGNNVNGATGMDMSADGRYVVFASFSDNLDPAVTDDNRAPDIFLRDRQAGTTVMVSTDGSGHPGNLFSTGCRISADGRWVVFFSFATNLTGDDMGNNAENEGDVFIYDVQTGAMELVSVNDHGQQGNGASGYPDVSDDGSRVAFESHARNLDVTRGETGWHSNVFVRNRANGTTRLVSQNTAGQEDNDVYGSTFAVISGNGRYVAFSSPADNLAPGDDNGWADVFLRDTLQGTTELVSVASDGTRADYVSFPTSISRAGRFVVYRTLASNLVPDDDNRSSDVLIRDRRRGITEAVSVSTLGELGDSDSGEGIVSPGGRFVVFSSGATNFYPGDSLYSTDVFIRDRGPQDSEDDLDGCDDIQDLRGDVRREMGWIGLLPLRLRRALRDKLGAAHSLCRDDDVAGAVERLVSFRGTVSRKRGGLIPARTADRWIDRSWRVFD